MTVQQQVCIRVNNMSDEGAEFINQIINNMKPSFFVDSPAPRAKIDKTDVSKRFGAGKGIIGNTDNFDKYNDEIADMFEVYGE